MRVRLTAQLVLLALPVPTVQILQQILLALLVNTLLNWMLYATHVELATAAPVQRKRIMQGLTFITTVS